MPRGVLSVAYDTERTNNSQHGSAGDVAPH
jgi:hypothetical protein